MRRLVHEARRNREGKDMLRSTAVVIDAVAERAFRSSHSIVKCEGACVFDDCLYL